MSILASRAARRAPSRVRAATTNSACPWNMTSSSANSGSSANTGAMSFSPGMLGQQHRDDPRRVRDRAEIEALHDAACFVRHPDRKVEGCLRCECHRYRRPILARADGRNRGVAACGRPTSPASDRQIHSAAWSIPIWSAQLRLRFPSASFENVRRDCHAIRGARTLVGQRLNSRRGPKGPRVPAGGLVEIGTRQRLLGRRCAPGRVAAMPP